LSSNSYKNLITYSLFLFSLCLDSGRAKLDVVSPARTSSCNAIAIGNAVAAATNAAADKNARAFVAVIVAVVGFVVFVVFIVIVVVVCPPFIPCSAVTHGVIGGDAGLRSLNI
jgi:ABC-type enterochelin transport system permease subunit